MATLQNPSVGIDAATGGTITGWDHVEQSLRDIFFTQFGTRVMREWYGSFVPNLLGQNITPKDVTPFFVAVTSAIEQWEPRYRVTRIEIVKVTREGGLHFFLDGEYRPRAVFGDLTAVGARRVDAYANPDGIRIERRAQLGYNLLGLMTFPRHLGPPDCQNTYPRWTSSKRADH